jgi:hypothetical protein
MFYPSTEFQVAVTFPAGNSESWRPVTVAAVD